MKKTTALVTGGCGFIGSHLVEALIKRGHKVRILDDLSTGKRDNIVPFSSQDDVWIGDVADFKTAEAAVKGCEYVFHESAIASVPKSVNDPIYKESRPGDIRHSLANNTALKAFGWSPSMNIREGLSQLLETTHKCLQIKI